MTQDEIIRMAREAGFASLDYLTHNRLERFAALVAAHEREACVKVCDEPSYMKQRTKTSAECAAAIRQRGMDLLTQHSQSIGEYDD